LLVLVGGLFPLVPCSGRSRRLKFQQHLIRTDEAPGCSGFGLVDCFTSQKPIAAEALFFLILSHAAQAAPEAGSPW